ncbi:MAG: hypothetical protein Tsb0018_06420 [Opitutales bacterium]
MTAMTLLLTSNTVIPRKGSQAYSVQLPNNTIYLFSSKETRDLFQANPDKYFPQYGGFCAYAMVKTGEKVKVDPTVWAIVKGKLYLNYSKSIGKRWQKKTLPVHQRGQ